MQTQYKIYLKILSTKANTRQARTVKPNILAKKLKLTYTALANQVTPHKRSCMSSLKGKREVLGTTAEYFAVMGTLTSYIV